MKKLNKKITLITTCVLAIIFGIMVFVKAQPEKKKVEVKLLWKKEFPNGVKYVGSLGYYPGFEGKPDLAPPYPRTIIAKKPTYVQESIYFLSPKGEVEQEIPISENQRAFASENGKYILIMTIDKSLFGKGAWGFGTKEVVMVPGEKNPYKWPIVENKARYKMINWKGEVLWEKVLPLYCNQSYCSMPLISNKGMVVTFEGFWNQEFLEQRKYLPKDIYSINFIDKQGNVIKREETGGYARCAFSRNGNNLICPLGKLLILYESETSSKLKEYSVTEFFGFSEVLFSKNNKYIIFYIALDLVKTKTKEGKEVISIKSSKEKIERYIYIFDKSLNLLYKKLDYQSSGPVSTSGDDKYFGIKKGNSISFLEVSVGKILWEKELPIISFDVSSNGKFIIAGGKNYFVILNRNGEKLIEDLGFPDTIVKVKINPNGKFFVLQGEKGMYLYEIQQ